MVFKAIVTIPKKAFCHCTVEVVESTMEGAGLLHAAEEKCALPKYTADEDREMMRVGKGRILEVGTRARKRDLCSTSPICNSLDQGKWIYHESLEIRCEICTLLNNPRCGSS
jgi:hypothetical protein